MLRVVFVSLLLALTGGGTHQASQTRDHLAALRTEWATNLHAKKLEAFVAMYTPDATFVGGGKRSTGRAAIYELTKSVMNTFTSDIELRSVKTEFSGELAYDSGEFSETLTSIANGTKTPARGYYLTIYKRSGGKWLIVQQVWSDAGAASDNPVKD